MFLKKISTKILLLLAATAIMIGCSEFEDIDSVSPVQTEGATAFIKNTTPTSMAFTPDMEATFDVCFSRSVTTDAITITIQSTDVDNVFTIPTEVSFDAGIDTAVMSIAYNLEIGTASTLSLKISEEDSYLYGNDSISIEVALDYTWTNAGIVSFTSAWAGATADLDVEGAKELEGLYRILSPYYVLEPSYCPAAGYHLQFMLDENYDAESVINSFIGETDADGADFLLYWDASRDDCSFANDSNSFVINGLWALSGADGLSLYNYATESFVWSTGYPGGE